MGSMERKNGNDGAVDGLGGPANDELMLLKNQFAAIGKSQAIAEYGIDGRVLTANDNFLSAFGYTLGEVQGQHHSMFVGSDERAGMDYRIFWDKLARGEAASGQYLRVGRDGKTVWLQASYCGVVDAEGKPCKVIEIASDITEAKLKAIEVEAELKVRSDIMDVTSIVSYADLRGDILSVNEKYIEVSKFSRDELIGRPHNITRHPDMPKEVFKEMWGTIGRGRMFRGKIKNRAKDGTPYYVDAVIAPIMGDNGKPKKYLGVRYDITETEVERQNNKGILDAIDASFAFIEFDTAGTILGANKNFLDVVGYSLDEIVGRHHRIFVDPVQANSSAYGQFWTDLKNGKAFVDVFKRMTKSGEEVWIQAVYSPVKDEMGRVFKVVKIAIDVTKEKLKSADYEGQLAAIGKAQAVIEFTLEGKILNANDNFLNAVGYTLAEIKGQHHSMFVEPEHRSSVEYRMFWEKLARGEYDAGQYKRVAKGGKELWLQASYNPIMDLNGLPFKVVKYASDTTAQVRAAQALQEAVEQTQAVVGAAQEGDLTQRISMEGKSGSVADLCEGVNSLVENMATVVGQVKDASEVISTASKEIAQGNADLSARTENQASSLEETASSMEELTSTVKQNADNASRANQLAAGASDVAVRGGDVVRQVVVTMNGISESSKKISDIIGVIDGIAFQTNILALNAAVEAARAGEQGRGFAVVATEVRNLAQRSAAAAKEIKALISDSVDKVNAGSGLVGKAGETMDEIVSAVRRVTDIMSEISAASQEQSAGIEQVNQAITQMDDVTQQNAALVEQAAAASESLEEQVSSLVQSVSMFRLSDDADEAQAWSGADRRGPNRASNVARPPFGKPGEKSQAGGPKRNDKPVRTGAAVPKVKKVANSPSAGSDEEWEEF